MKRVRAKIKRIKHRRAFILFHENSPYGQKTVSDKTVYDRRRKHKGTQQDD